MSLLQCSGMKLEFLVLESAHSVFLSGSNSSKIIEIRLRDRFLLLRMKIKDEDSNNNILFSNRAFSDVSEGVTSKIFLGESPRPPFYNEVLMSH